MVWRPRVVATFAAVPRFRLRYQGSDLELPLTGAFVVGRSSACSLALDDGRLSRTKELVAGLKARLDVSERLVAAEAKPLDEIPLGEAAGSDILEQVSAYFDAAKAKPAKTDVAAIDLDADRLDSDRAGTASAKR